MPDSLAEIVIEEGLLSAEKLSQAADEADMRKLPLVVPVVRDYGVDEVSLVAALKRYLRIKTLDPAKVEFDSDALRELSLEESRRLRAVPISVGTYGAGPRLLRVAMADPTDTVSLAELEHLTGCTVEPVLVTLSAVEEMIETAYKHFVTEVMKRIDLGKTPKRSPDRKKSVTRPMIPLIHPAGLAGTGMQIEALVKLCVAKGLFEQDEYEAALAALTEAKPPE